MSEFIPTAWVRTNCPYSFKFRLFVTEAGLSDQFSFIPMDPDSPDFATIKGELDRKAGRSITFPLVEVAPNQFMTDSDALITHFADRYGLDDSAMPTLSFYRSGLYVCYLEMFAILAKPLGWIARLGRHPKAFR